MLPPMATELWAAVFAAYLTGGVYFAHSISKILWKIAFNARGIPRWLRAEMGTVALLGALYLIAWPVVLAAYMIFRGLMERRIDEVQHLIGIGMQEWRGEAPVPMPAKATPEYLETQSFPVSYEEMPKHFLFLCPEDPTCFPAEDPGLPMDRECKPVCYAHGELTWIRSVMCGCGEWIDVYESGVRSDHACASLEHEPQRD